MILYQRSVYIGYAVGCLSGLSNTVNRWNLPSCTCLVSSLRGSLVKGSRLPVGSWNRSMGGICSPSSLWGTSLSRSLCTRDAYSSLWLYIVHVYTCTCSTDSWWPEGSWYWILCGSTGGTPCSVWGISLCWSLGGGGELSCDWSSGVSGVPGLGWSSEGVDVLDCVWPIGVGVSMWVWSVGVAGAPPSGTCIWTQL